VLHFISRNKQLFVKPHPEARWCQGWS
jgi:hypothetical protein